MTIDPRIVGTWRMKGTVGRDDAGNVLAPPSHSTANNHPTPMNTTKPKPSGP